MTNIFSTLKQQIPRFPPAVLIVMAFGMALFATLLFFVHRIEGSDDIAFQDQTAPFPTLLEWIHYRYHSWSGRTFSESFVYIFSNAPLVYWKLVSFIIYCVFSIMCLLYYRLFDSTKHTFLQDATLAIVIVLLPFLINPSVFFEGTFWVTGSMNYFWIVTAGLVAFYPLAYYHVRQKHPPAALTLLGLLCGVVACSQEQLGAVLITLTFFAILFRSISQHNFKPSYIVYPGVFFLFFLVSFFIAITAPGNEQRLAAETVTWLPDFYKTPILERIGYSYRWILDSLINHTGALLIALWTGFLALFAAHSYKKDWLSYITIGVFSVALGLIVVKYLNIAPYLYEFYPTWKVPIPKLSTYMGLLIWPLIILFTIIAPAIYYRTLLGVYYSLFIAAAVASAAIITLSPTMYASGLRTLFVPSMILTLALLPLIRELVRSRHNIAIYIVTITITTITGFQCVYMLVNHIKP